MASGGQAAVVGDALMDLGFRVTFHSRPSGEHLWVTKGKRTPWQGGDYDLRVAGAMIEVISGDKEAFDLLVRAGLGGHSRQAFINNETPLYFVLVRSPGLIPENLIVATSRARAGKAARGQARWWANDVAIGAAAVDDMFEQIRRDSDDFTPIWRDRLSSLEISFGTLDEVIQELEQHGVSQALEGRIERSGEGRGGER
jgi:hypothetical protein